MVLFLKFEISFLSLMEENIIVLGIIYIIEEKGINEKMELLFFTKTLIFEK